MKEVEFIRKEDKSFQFKVDGRDTKFSVENSVGEIKYGGKNPADHEEILFHALEVCNKIPKEHTLSFLQICIFVLTEAQRRFVRRPGLLQELIWLYWQTFQCQRSKNKDLISPDLAIDVCERYLDLLEDDANQDWFDRMVLDKGYKTTREEAVIEVVNELLLLLKKYREKLKNKDLTNDVKKETEGEKKRVEQALKEIAGRYPSIFDPSLAHYDFIEHVRGRYDRSEQMTIGRILQEGISRGVFNVQDPFLAATVVCTAMKGLEIPLFWRRKEESAFPHVDNLLHLLFYGLVKRPVSN